MNFRENSMISNNIYSPLVSAMPIEFVNLYYRFKNISKPDAWKKAPVYYIHVPKTAGSSICDALGLPDSGHLLFSEMRAETAHLLSQKRCFIVIRDPLHRLLSTYHYAKDAKNNNRRNIVNFVGGFETFEGFLNEVIHNNKILQHYFLRPASHFYNDAVANGANVDIIKFEDVNTVLPEYFNDFGLDISELPRKKVSKSKKNNQIKIPTYMSNKLSEYFLEDEVLRSRALTS